MSKRKEIDWASLKNASPKPKRLHLEKESDEKYHCPLPNCEHQGFISQRGCRKHVKSNHGWFYYFDVKPDVRQTVSSDGSTPSGKREKPVGSSIIPTFPVSSAMGESFSDWLTGCGGGGKLPRDAKQIVSRAFKFLKFCCEDEEEVTDEIMDFSISSPIMLFKFVDALQDEYNIGHSGRVGYLDAISELIDFRKISGTLQESVLRNVAVTEVHLKKARKTVAKMMKLQWNHDLDIDTLESKGHWATMDELLRVIPHHLPKYEQILQQSKCHPQEPVCSLDLSFATRFIAVYLFLKVKCSRPMTFQFLTTKMIDLAKTNEGFVDQTQFKTAKTYGFDSLVLTKSDIQVIDDYIHHIRPRLEPKCDYVLVTRNGKQYDKLSNLMTKMVFDAIGKYIHPSRYRQIVETESVKNLSREEQDVVSKNQKHSSIVARVHYQKQHSRDIAIQGREYIKKLRGDKGEQVEQYIQSKLCEVDNSSALNMSMPNNDDETPIPSETLSTLQPIDSNNNGSTNTFDRNKNEEADIVGTIQQVVKPSPKRLRFTSEEDRNLKEALLHYGNSQWTAILNDKNFKFQKGRKADSLKKRAESKFPKLCK